MTRITTIAALVLILLIGSTATAQSEPQRHRGKKLIEWGWDEPDTKFMRNKIETMEQFSFDGLVFHATSKKGENLAWEVWGTKKFAPEDFDQAVVDLKATKFRRFTDRFLRVNVTPAKVDWFDDEAWACVVNNFGVAAQLAKEGRCKGFMFDTEQYEGVTVFDYRKQKDQGKKSFAEYQQQVRQRGKEWMRAVNKHFPDITILLTFGYDVSIWHAEKPKDRSTAAYGLLADFLDGVLEACAKETVLVDAWEFAYAYKERKQFERAYETITKKALDWTAVPEKYKKQVQAGFGIWMDHKNKEWDVADFSKNYFSPADIEAAVRSALEVSDGYVWIYSERPKWWTKEKLPQAYVDALTTARKGVGRTTPANGKAKPVIKKLGTLDLLMVETTPVVFKDRLYRFEYVRDNYPANKTGASYFRLMDVATGSTTPAFAKGQHLGCAFVDRGTFYAYGVDKWGGSKITVFRSKDMEKWEERLALRVPGWELFNTSVCKADGRYVMAVEVGGPKEVVGVPFTIFFAESKDLLDWKLLPQECAYSKEKYTACPALRYFDGYFYMLYLEAKPGPSYETHVVRSKDLKRWESSRLNPVMAFSDKDKAIANPKLTAAQRKAVAQAKDINNSDVDVCEFKGKTIIYYSWGNQQGKEFLAEAVYDGTLAEFLGSYFP